MYEKYRLKEKSNLELLELLSFSDVKKDKNLIEKILKMMK